MSPVQTGSVRDSAVTVWPVACGQLSLPFLQIHDGSMSEHIGKRSHTRCARHLLCQDKIQKEYMTYWMDQDTVNIQ